MKATLEILLDNDLYNGKGTQPTFVPGQAISGHVVYTPASRRDVEEVTILLLRRCSTVIRRPDLTGFGKDAYAEEIVLFRLKRTLLTGPFTMQATTAKSRFGFVLPTKAVFIRNVGEDNWLYGTQAHQLPPTILSAAHGHKAVISYSLRVVINSGHLRGSEAWNLPIAVTTCSEEVLPGTETVRSTLAVTKQLRIRTQVIEKVNFRQKMGRVFSKKIEQHIPFPFHIEAHMPDVASISQPLSVSVSVRAGAGAKDGVSMPLSLLWASLGLIAMIHVRVKTRMGDLDEKIWEESGQQKVVGSEYNLHANGEPIELSNSIRLADLVHEEVRQRITPSFKTYTINRSYYLKLTIEIRDQTSNHTFQLEGRLPFLILPTEHPSVNLSAANALLPSYNEAGLNLPAYIEHASGE